MRYKVSLKFIAKRLNFSLKGMNFIAKRVKIFNHANLQPMINYRPNPNKINGMIFSTHKPIR